MRRKFTRLSITFGLLSFAGYSISDAIAKYALGVANVNYASYLVVLNLTGLLLSLIVGLKMHGVSLFKIPKDKVKPVITRTFFNGVNILGATYAIARLPLEIFYSVIFLAPLIATLLAHFFIKEKITKSIALALALAFLGVTIVLQPWQVSGFSKSYVSALMVALIMPFCIACITIINRKHLVKVKTFTVVFYSALAVSGLALSLALFQDAKFSISLAEFKYPAIAGLFIFGGASLSLMAFKLGKVQNVAVTQYTQFVWAILFSIFVFNHNPALSTYVGILLVVSANILNLVKK